MLNELSYARGVEDGMAKFAISRFRQYARDATQAASNSQNPAAIAAAQQVTSQAYKPRVLGTGAEGTATLRMMPQASEGGALTPTVRKEFDPKSPLASPELIDRRVALGPELNKSKNFAQFYGHGQTDAGRRFIDSEFVPGKVAPGADVSKAQASMDSSLRSAGMKKGIGHLAAKDTRVENLGVNPKTGKTVALDFMPMKRQEAYDPRFARMTGLEQSSVIPTDAGAKLFPNSAKEFADPGNIQKTKMDQMMKNQMTMNPGVVVPPKQRPATALPPVSPASAQASTVASRPSAMPASPAPAPTQAGMMPKTMPMRPRPV